MNNHFGLVMHFVDGPDVLRQSCPPLNTETPCDNDNTQYFKPTLVADCFNVFIGCVNVSNRKVTIVQGLEQLTTVSTVEFEVPRWAI